MIERKQQALRLGKREITVWEANWDMGSTPARVEEEAHKLRASLNGSGDPALLDFYELVYPWLFAYSTGNVPTLEEAYELPDKDLDKWYEALRCTNPELFPETIVADTTVTFRDDSTLTIRSTEYPSVLRRSFQYTSKAFTYLTQHPNDNQEFARLQVYGKLACCTVGNVPSYEEMRNWPVTELQKWYNAVLQHNPQLFVSPQEAEEKSLEEQQATDAKKKSQRKRS
jgi:hypothetical protein